MMNFSEVTTKSTGLWKIFEQTFKKLIKLKYLQKCLCSLEKCYFELKSIKLKLQFEKWNSILCLNSVSIYYIYWYLQTSPASSAYGLISINKASFFKNRLYNFINISTVFSFCDCKPTAIATFSACSFVKPFIISTGSYIMASGFSAATSSIFIPPWEEAIMAGPYKLNYFSLFCEVKFFHTPNARSIITAK